MISIRSAGRLRMEFNIADETIELIAFVTAILLMWKFDRLN